MYGNIYNNLYGNSNPYAEPQTSESARTAAGDSYGQDAVDEQSTSLVVWPEFFEIVENRSQDNCSISNNTYS